MRLDEPSYVLMFPTCVTTAKLLEKRPLLIAGLCAWMVTGLFWYSALFAQWYWVGLEAQPILVIHSMQSYER
jgi:hypothetical protein